MNKPNGKQTVSPLGILVAGANGTLATVPIHKDASGGFVAVLNETTFHLTATLTGGMGGSD